jgi:hypothetical protein
VRSIPVDLSIILNADAATFDRDRAAGFVNAWGNSFPAEELPFGQLFNVGGVAYKLPPKRRGNPDHVEALGQVLDLERAVSACGIAMLGFGELGAQSVDVRVSGRTLIQHHWRATLPNWLVPSIAPSEVDSWRASHLHYAAGYQLNDLCPRVSSVTHQLPTNFELTRVTLGENPLAHVMAISLLVPGGPDA